MKLHQAKKNRIQKIITVGDSATFGYGVDAIERIKLDNYPMQL